MVYKKVSVAVCPAGKEVKCAAGVVGETATTVVDDLAQGAGRNQIEASDVTREQAEGITHIHVKIVI